MGGNDLVLPILLQNIDSNIEEYLNPICHRIGYVEFIHIDQTTFEALLEPNHAR